MLHFRFDGTEARRLREALDLKQEFVALKIHRTKESVVAYERNIVRTPPMGVVALCELYGCDPGDLFHRVDE